MRVSFCLLSAALFATACTSSGDAPTGPTEYLFTSDTGASGQVHQYALPLTVGELPTLSFAAPHATAIALDKTGDVVISRDDGDLVYFELPTLPTSVATATITTGASATGQSVFGTDSNCYVASSVAIADVFTPPFTSTSVPSKSITGTGVTAATGAAFDTQNNFYLTNQTTSTTSGLVVFAPPYSTVKASTIAVTGQYQQLAASDTEVFVSNSGTPGTVDAYLMPLTVDSAPEYSIVTGINKPNGLAIDTSGNLYVANTGNSTVTMYSPPFSAASAPTETLTVGGSLSGLAFYNEPTSVTTGGGNPGFPSGW